MKEKLSNKQVELLIKSMSLLSDANTSIANAYYTEFGNDADIEENIEYIKTQDRIIDAIEQIGALLGAVISRSFYAKG